MQLKISEDLVAGRPYEISQWGFFSDEFLNDPAYHASLPQSLERKTVRAGALANLAEADS